MQDSVAGALEELELLGRFWLRGYLSRDDVGALGQLCDVGAKPGERLALNAELARFVGAPSTFARRVAFLGVDPAPVRLVAFNKSATANWAVPWHQDRVVAVAERSDTPGYANWVAKRGFWHVEPPVDVLRNMLFVRVHIDRCDEGNGALELALGSHRRGVVDARSARCVASEAEVEVCSAEAGDILIVKALTLHRSRSSTSAAERRALRVDYARRDRLARGVRWALPLEPA